MPTNIVYTCLIVLLALLSCNQNHELKGIFRAQENTAGSIYSDFKIGDNEWYLTTPKDSVQLYIFEWGTGKDTVVVLHGGFGAEHRYLKDAFEGLYNRYHFIFYDQRGSLRSPCPSEKISIQNHIEDLEALRKELNIKRLNLFGHSNGSALATYYLRKYPNNVKGFVMTACMQMESPLTGDLINIETEIYKEFDAFINRTEIKEEIQIVERDSTIPPSKMKYQIERINMARYYIYDIRKWKSGKESYGKFYNNAAGTATARSMNELFPDGYSNIELYRKHPYPITIIMGEMDMIDPGGRKFSIWTEDLANVHHVLIGQAAHDPWLDEPEVFKAIFVEAMNRYY